MEDLEDEDPFDLPPQKQYVPQRSRIEEDEVQPNGKVFKKRQKYYESSLQNQSLLVKYH